MIEASVCCGRWYKGTVLSYDSRKDLHHVKYADRDRADICMKHEAVILVLEEVRRMTWSLRSVFLRSGMLKWWWGTLRRPCTAIRLPIVWPAGR